MTTRLSMVALFLVFALTSGCTVFTKPPSSTFNGGLGVTESFETDEEERNKHRGYHTGENEGQGPPRHHTPEKR